MQTNTPHRKHKPPDLLTPNTKRLKPDPIDVDLEDAVTSSSNEQSPSQLFGIYQTDFKPFLLNPTQNTVNFNIQNPVNLNITFQNPKPDRSTINNNLLQRVKIQQNAILPIQDEIPVQDLENIFQRKENNEISDISKPKFLCCDLLQHQRTCLAWMLSQEKGKYKGGILADEMGWFQ